MKPQNKFERGIINTLDNHKKAIEEHEEKIKDLMGMVERLINIVDDTQKTIERMIGNIKKNANSG